MEAALKVSVITVCYNSEKTIRGTIESVLSQNYPFIEHIIVDGLSKDGTMNVINEYKGRISQIISESDLGIYDAMNKGLAKATGDIIGILNSDDIFDSPDVISNVVDHFNSVPSAEIVFGDTVYVDPENIDKVTRFYCSKNFKPFKLRYGWMPPHPSTFIKANVYQKFGNYSIDYKISGDYELFVRLFLLHNVCFSRLDKILVRMRSGGVSSSGVKSKWVLNNEIVKACRANGIYTNIFFVLLKMPMKMMEMIRRPSL